MEVLIVTGLSGAGKTSVLKILEDQGFYCIDNISSGLLNEIIYGEMREEGFAKKLAVTMDIRSYGLMEGFDRILSKIRQSGIDVKVLFLECSNNVLIKRYKENRRLHPVMAKNKKLSLKEAIIKERSVMESFKDKADLIIDTSAFKSSDLREKIGNIFFKYEENGMIINFVAFGYKYGILEDADLVFDVRCLPNPYYIPELREKTGEDKEVRDYVMSFEESRELFKRMLSYIEYAIPLYEKEGKAQLVVGLGCTGGQHRSVTFAKLLADHFRNSYTNLNLRKRDMMANQGKILKEEI